MKATLVAVALWTVVSAPIMARDLSTGDSTTGQSIQSVREPVPGMASVGRMSFALLCGAVIVSGLMIESRRNRSLRESRRLLVELATQNERLTLLNKEKNEFLCMASHDLKNPLTVILFSADMLKVTRDPNRVNNLVKVIHDAGSRMQAMIASLLDARGMENGQFTSEVEPCSLRALIDLCVEQNQPAATRKGIRIDVRLVEGLRADANWAAAMRILDNLLSNALKFSLPGSTVYVRSNAEDQNVLVSVRDEGPGLNEQDQAKLFQSRACLSARPTGGESSTGYGLMISKRLAEAMRGSIECKSVPGIGSTFTMRLPASQPEVPFTAPQILHIDEVRLAASRNHAAVHTVLADARA